MKTSEAALSIVAALLIALLAGYLWGASGRRASGRALDASRLRADLLEARGSALSARVDLYNVNFGNASRDLQAAIDRLQASARQLEARGSVDDRQAVADAAAKAGEAHRLAGTLDPAANTRAADAVAAIDRVLAHAPR